MTRMCALRLLGIVLWESQPYQGVYRAVSFRSSPDLLTFIYFFCQFLTTVKLAMSNSTVILDFSCSFSLLLYLTSCVLKLLFRRFQDVCVFCLDWSFHFYAMPFFSHIRCSKVDLSNVYLSMSAFLCSILP